MDVFTTVTDPEIVRRLQAGGIGVLRTDTLYGVVARADDEMAVERVYALKGRDDAKSPIVLISSLSQLYDQPDEPASELLADVWPGKVSIILDSRKAPTWITRGNDSVAYRLPARDDLRDLISQTGPLIAPSANPQGERPAMTIRQAEAYFGDEVDFYVDEGTVTDETPSQLLHLSADGEVERLR
jgi:L-threonylcarbamoyladenylate synthase